MRASLIDWWDGFVKIQQSGMFDLDCKLGWDSIMHQLSTLEAGAVVTDRLVLKVRGCSRDKTFGQ